jgi:hypothetical protein
MGPEQNSGVLPTAGGEETVSAEQLHKGFELAGSLQTSLAVNEQDLNRKIRLRDGEIADVRIRHQTAIGQVETKIIILKDTIREHLHEIGGITLEGWRTGSIDPEDVIYAAGLINGIDQPPVFDFARAEHDLERFRQLQPGAKILHVACDGEVDDPAEKIANLKLLDGGILAEAPQVGLAEGTRIWDIQPEIHCKYNDGRTISRLWRYKMAIGDSEVEKLASIWLEDHSPDQVVMPGLGCYSDMRLLSSELVCLKRLGLDLPPQSQLLKEMMTELEASLEIDRNPNDWELDRTMANIYLLDEELFRQVVGRLVNNANYVNWHQLAECIAVNSEPNWGSMTSGNRDTAIARAAYCLNRLILEITQDQRLPSQT